MNFISKTFKTGKGVASGIVDYSRQMKEVNAQAEKNLSRSYGNSSTAADAQRVGEEIQRLKKERNISLKNSVRSKLGLQ
jgi:hypothetical protein